MKKTLLEQYVEDPQQLGLFLEERAILEVTEQLEALLAEKGISRAEFAERLGKTRGWVTQLLDGEANKTIRTVARAFAALDREFYPTHRPIRVGKQSYPQVTASGMASGSTDTREEATILQFSPQLSTFSSDKPEPAEALNG